jgi:DNA-binding NarL/FixJ family response regulator
MPPDESRAEASVPVYKSCRPIPADRCLSRGYSGFPVAFIVRAEDIIVDAEMSALRTLLVDDHLDFRKLLRSMLEEKTGCVVIGEASNGLEAVEQAKEIQPDLILLDLSLPKLNGMEAGRRIRKICPHSKIIFLSQDDSPQIVHGALRLGAAGYLLKSDAIELPLAVNAILQGKVFVSRRVKDS